MELKNKIVQEIIGSRYWNNKQQFLFTSYVKGKQTL